MLEFVWGFLFCNLGVCVVCFCCLYSWLGCGWVVFVVDNSLLGVVVLGCLLSFVFVCFLFGVVWVCVRVGSYLVGFGFWGFAVFYLVVWGSRQLLLGCFVSFCGVVCVALFYFLWFLVFVCLWILCAVCLFAGAVWVWVFVLFWVGWVVLFCWGGFVLWVACLVGFGFLLFICLSVRVGCLWCFVCLWFVGVGGLLCFQFVLCFGCFLVVFCLFFCFGLFGLGLGLGSYLLCDGGFCLGVEFPFLFVLFCLLVFI